MVKLNESRSYADCVNDTLFQVLRSARVGFSKTGAEYSGDSKSYKALLYGVNLAILNAIKTYGAEHFKSKIQDKNGKVPESLDMTLIEHKIFLYEHHRINLNILMEDAQTFSPTELHTRFKQMGAFDIAKVSNQRVISRLEQPIHTLVDSFFNENKINKQDPNSSWRSFSQDVTNRLYSQFPLVLNTYLQQDVPNWVDWFVDTRSPDHVADPHKSLFNAKPKSSAELKPNKDLRVGASQTSKEEPKPNEEPKSMRDRMRNWGQSVSKFGSNVVNKVKDALSEPDNAPPKPSKTRRDLDKRIDKLKQSPHYDPERYKPLTIQQRIDRLKAAQHKINSSQVFDNERMISENNFEEGFLGDLGHKIHKGISNLTGDISGHGYDSQIMKYINDIYLQAKSNGEELTIAQLIEKLPFDEDTIRPREVIQLLQRYHHPLLSQMESIEMDEGVFGDIGNTLKKTVGNTLSSMTGAYTFDEKIMSWVNKIWNDAKDRHEDLTLTQLYERLPFDEDTIRPRELYQLLQKNHHPLLYRTESIDEDFTNDYNSNDDVNSFEDNLSDEDLWGILKHSKEEGIDPIDAARDLGYPDDHLMKLSKMSQEDLDSLSVDLSNRFDHIDSLNHMEESWMDIYDNVRNVNREIRRNNIKSSSEIFLIGDPIQVDENYGGGIGHISSINEESVIVKLTTGEIKGYHISNISLTDDSQWDLKNIGDNVFETSNIKKISMDIPNGLQIVSNEQLVSDYLDESALDLWNSNVNRLSYYGDNIKSLVVNEANNIFKLGGYDLRVDNIFYDTHNMNDIMWSINEVRNEIDEDSDNGNEIIYESNVLASEAWRRCKDIGINCDIVTNRVIFKEKSEKNKFINLAKLFNDYHLIGETYEKQCSPDDCDQNDDEVEENVDDVVTKIVCGGKSKCFTKMLRGGGKTKSGGSGGGGGSSIHRTYHYHTPGGRAKQTGNIM